MVAIATEVMSIHFQFFKRACALPSSFARACALPTFLHAHAHYPNLLHAHAHSPNRLHAHAHATFLFTHMHTLHVYSLMPGKEVSTVFCEQFAFSTISLRILGRFLKDIAGFVLKRSFHPYKKMQQL